MTGRGSPLAPPGLPGDNDGMLGIHPMEVMRMEGDKALVALRGDGVR
ncbi:hypothetical protein V5E97_12955 [Singulisphaera sp. Ch08]|uniref:Uncharacterized protein n=1 Tax=Singulisphaera sp. Ch08 TaxID=3120278 RepID=A0AAU7CNN7_9BACT